MQPEFRELDQRGIEDLSAANLLCLAHTHQGRPRAATSTPPRLGPVAAATPPEPPQSAVAVARWLSGNSGRTRPSELGTSMAPPIACRARAAISTSRVGLSPQTADKAR